MHGIRQLQRALTVDKQVPHHRRDEARLRNRNRESRDGRHHDLRDHVRQRRRTNTQPEFSVTQHPLAMTNSDARSRPVVND